MNTQPLRLGVLLFAAIALAWLSYVAVARGLADEHGEAARVIMSGWSNGVNAAEWHDAKSHLTQALSYDAGHGANTYRMARLHHLCAVYLVNCGLPKATAITSAKQYYQKSIALRPQWARGIAHYAVLKRDLGEVDAEFFALIDSAMAIGPLVPAVQRLLTQIALTLWPVFDVDQQAQLANVVVSGLKSGARGVKQNIVQLLGAHRQQVKGLMFDRLVRYMLVQSKVERWDADYAAFVFMFWSRWTVNDRITLVQGLNNKTQNKRINYVLRVAKNYKKLPVACAILRQTKALEKACQNKKFRQMFKK